MRTTFPKPKHTREALQQALIQRIQNRGLPGSLAAAFIEAQRERPDLWSVPFDGDIAILANRELADRDIDLLGEKWKEQLRPEFEKLRGRRQSDTAAGVIQEFEDKVKARIGERAEISYDAAWQAASADGRLYRQYLLAKQLGETGQSSDPSTAENRQPILN